MRFSALAVVLSMFIALNVEAMEDQKASHTWPPNKNYAVSYDGYGTIERFITRNKHWMLRVCENDNAECTNIAPDEMVHIPYNPKRKTVLLDEHRRWIGFPKLDDPENVKRWASYSEQFPALEHDDGL